MRQQGCLVTRKRGWVPLLSFYHHQFYLWQNFIVRESQMPGTKALSIRTNVQVQHFILIRWSTTVPVLFFFASLLSGELTVSFWRTLISSLTAWCLWYSTTALSGNKLWHFNLYNYFPTVRSCPAYSPSPPSSPRQSPCRTWTPSPSWAKV